MAKRHDTATCIHCRRSRPMRLLERSATLDVYVCRDVIDCSVATQWAPGGDDGR